MSEINLTSLSIYNMSGPPWGRSLYVRPARTHSNGCKSPNRPDSGKVTK